MALEKGGDEDLVFQGQPRQLRQLKGAFDGDIAHPHPLDHQGRALRQLGQFLPVFGLGHGRLSMTRPRYLRKSIFQEQ